MKNSTLTSTLKSLKLWPEAKRLRLLELILLLLLIGTAGYAGAIQMQPKPLAPTPPVSFGHTPNPIVTPAPAPTPVPAPAPVITPVVTTAVAPVIAAVVPPVVITTTTDNGGDGGAEAPVVVDPVQLTSGITGLTQNPGVCIPMPPFNTPFCIIPITPKANATFSVFLAGSKSEPVTVTSDDNGAFTLDLDPGDYTIVPAPEASYSYFSIPVTVVADQYTKVNVVYTEDPSTIVAPPAAPGLDL